MNFDVITKFWDNQTELSILSKDQKASCRMDIYKDEPSVAVLSGLYIDESYRQQGFGRELLRYCLDVAKYYGCTKVQLRSDLDFTNPNDQGNWILPWYKREGFQPISCQVWLERELQ